MGSLSCRHYLPVSAPESVDKSKFPCSPPLGLGKHKHTKDGMAISYPPNAFPNPVPLRRSRTVSVISRSYIKTAFSAEKNSARFNSNVLGGGFSRVRRMASARASTSPTGTRRPIRPPSRISAGPEGQSVLTQGQPQASASIKTFCKPYIREDIANRDARAMKA